MVKTALEVHAELKKIDILASVINIHTIKPLDEKFLVNAIQKTKVVATLEEHNKLCGLGSAISEIISSNSLNKKQYFLELMILIKKQGAINT